MRRTIVVCAAAAIAATATTAIGAPGVVRADYDYVPPHVVKGRLTGKVRVYPAGQVLRFDGVLNAYRVSEGQLVFRPPHAEFSANPARSVIVTWSVPCYRIGRVQPWRLGVAITATNQYGTRGGVGYSQLFTVGCR